MNGIYKREYGNNESFDATEVFINQKVNLRKHTANIMPRDYFD